MYDTLIKKLPDSIHEKIHARRTRWRRRIKGVQVGQTPLFELEHYSELAKTTLFAKMESYNPTRSAKDRIVMFMINEAERKGLLKPGGTVIEATSGNTGAAIAHICNLRGYKCMITTKDKVSKNKIDALKAAGAMLEICPGSAGLDDPRNYVRRAEALNYEIPNSYYLNQNYNPENAQAHFQSTGPEIWSQMKGEITHFVAPVSTGGTLCGTSKYLKQRNPDLVVYGVDAFGSVLGKYHETGELKESEKASYYMDGVGKKFIPGNIDFSLINEFIKVQDKAAAHRAREIKIMEGLYVGHSSGAALEAVLSNKSLFGRNDRVAIIFPDHGSKYLKSIFNDEWMAKRNFI